MDPDPGIRNIVKKNTSTVARKLRPKTVWFRNKNVHKTYCTFFSFLGLFNFFFGQYKSAGPQILATPCMKNFV